MTASRIELVNTGVGLAALMLLAALAWSAARWTYDPGNVASDVPRTDSVESQAIAKTVGGSSGPFTMPDGRLDLCAVMESAGAANFGRGGLRIFESLRLNDPAVAAVRQRRCSFRTHGVGRSGYQDLQVATSAHPESASRFYSAMQLAQSDVAAHFATESGIGVAGYSWARDSSHDTELRYLLHDGRLLMVRWIGEGTDPQADLAGLRNFTQRVAENIQ